jgi:hypothetical protein
MPVLLLLYITFNVTNSNLKVFIEESAGCTLRIVGVTAVRMKGP